MCWTGAKHRSLCDHQDTKTLPASMRTGAAVLAPAQPVAKKSLGKIWRKMGKMPRYGPHASASRRSEGVVERRGKSMEMLAGKKKRQRASAKETPAASRPNPLSLLSGEVVTLVASYLPIVTRHPRGVCYVTAALLTRLGRPDVPAGSPGGSTSPAARDASILRCADERLRGFYAASAAPRLIDPTKKHWEALARTASALATKFRDYQHRRQVVPRHRSRTLAELVAAVAALEPRDLRVPSAEFGTVQEAVDAARRGDRIFVEPGRYSDVLKIVDRSVAIYGGARPPSKGFERPGRTIFEAVDVTGRTAECLLVGVHFQCCDVGTDVSACSVSGGGSLVVVDAAISSRALLSGVTAREGASLRLVRCDVSGCRESAVFVHGAATAATLEHCVLNSNGASGLSAHSGATAKASRCDMLDNKENGCHASNATVALVDCACLDNAYNATFANHGGSVTVDAACRLGPDYLTD